MIFTKKDIQKYIQDDLKDLNPSSISRTISTLKSFYKYLKINNQIKINPMQAISRPKKAQKLPKVLSEDEIENLLDINLKTDYFQRPQRYEKEEHVEEFSKISFLRNNSIFLSLNISVFLKNAGINIWC